MAADRQAFPLRALAAIASFTVMVACQPQETGDTSATVSLDPPTLAELENATYIGLRDRPTLLTGGEWQGDPFAEGGASRPAIGLRRDFALTGDLDADGAEEAVVLLWFSAGGSGTFDYLAVMGRDATGAPVNLATAPLGDRVQIRAAEIFADQIVVDTVQAGPGDAACCPGQKLRRSFALDGDALSEVASEDQGRLSIIADLAGVEWRLTELDREDPLPDDIEVTLNFEDQRIAGISACNRYSGGVTEGGTPGALTVAAPLATTRMACPPPAGEIEHRYLEALQGVSHYSFVAGDLALTWSNDDERGTMMFRPRRR